MPETNKMIVFPEGRLLHGGDYNPDQWLKYPEILKEDLEWMKQAQVNCVTLGVFSWVKLEPFDGEYEFSWLHEIIDRLYKNGIYTILATPTGALPMWLSSENEEVRMMDDRGTRRLPGSRHNFCPSSPKMRQKMRQIDSRLSEEFGKHPGVIAWHISNEYGGRDGDCHCPYCEAAFRTWLQNRYGSLENLNESWWTGFWSHTYTDWEQIHSPSSIGENGLHGLKLDWRRFCSDQLLDFCKEEIRSVRAHSELPVLTNLMVFFKPLDYFKWAKELDMVSLDNYPSWHSQQDDIREGQIASAVFHLTRSLKKAPFLLMESTPSLVNWKQDNMVKRPGMHGLSSLQAVAYGADSVQYFQWRKSRGGVEKYHGAVIDHRNGNQTRTFREVAHLGGRLAKISKKVIGTLQKPKAALIFDWENWWAVEDVQAVSNHIDYLDTVLRYFRPFWNRGIDVDIINMDGDLIGYSLVVAPMNYMYRGNYMEHVRDFVKKGGTYVTTYWSGEVDGSDLCFLKSHPLSDVLGIEPEEIDAPVGQWRNMVSYQGKEYQVEGLTAILHTTTAKALAVYEKDFYKGSPAVTENHFGEGDAYFIASENEDAFHEEFFDNLFGKLHLESGFGANLPAGVTVTVRKKTDEKMQPDNIQAAVWFLQNFRAEEVQVTIEKSYIDIETGEQVTGTIVLEPYMCRILEG